MAMPFDESNTIDLSESEDENALKGLDANLLLASLLEEKCSMFVKDPNDAPKLFEELCKHLREFGVLSEESHSIKFQKSRKEQMDLLVDIMKTKTQISFKEPMLVTILDGNETVNDSLSEKDYTPQNARYKTEFEELKALGKGGFGSVFKVLHRLDQTEYAVKKIKPRYKDTMDILLREVKILARLKCKNIVGYNGAWLEECDSDSGSSGSSCSSESLEDGSSSMQTSQAQPSGNLSNKILYIHMELCSNNLQDFLKKRNESYTGLDKTVIEKSMQKNNPTIFRDILIGVNYIHNRGIIHRDLKPQNIFLTKNPESAKIGDFGLAKNVHNKHDVTFVLQQKGLGATKNYVKNTEAIGTYTYASPEQLQGDKYDFKTDIYSLGVILFEMYNNFDTDMEKFKCISDLRSKHEYCNNFKQNFSKEAEIIEKLITLNPSNRPIASTFLKSGLFSYQSADRGRQQRNARSRSARNRRSNAPDQNSQPL